MEPAPNQKCDLRCIARLRGLLPAELRRRELGEETGVRKAFPLSGLGSSSRLGIGGLRGNRVSRSRIQLPPQGTQEAAGPNAAAR